MLSRTSDHLRMYRDDETTGPMMHRLSEGSIKSYVLSRRAYRMKNKAAATMAGKRLSFNPKSPTVCNAEV